MKIKGFDKNLRCYGFQFEIGKEYKTNAKKCDLKLCSNTVFHYCNSIQNVNNYYSCAPKKGNRFCEIENLGDEIKRQDKCGSNHIKILREIKGEELYKLIGLTNGNTGLFNSGNLNPGNYNSGDYNPGNGNSGDHNPGKGNSGNGNSGGYNFGNQNSGLFNSCNNSNGVFCQKEPTIKCFDIDSGMTLSQFINSPYYDAIISAPFNLTEWIDDSRYISGGYLVTYKYKEACRNWWEKLTDKNKKIIQSIPNFDKNIFYDITGIEL